MEDTNIDNERNIRYNDGVYWVDNDKYWTKMKELMAIKASYSYYNTSIFGIILVQWTLEMRIMVELNSKSVGIKEDENYIELL